jgi:hypothetical protein
MAEVEGVSSGTIQFFVDGSVLSWGSCVLAIKLGICLWPNIEMCFLHCKPIVQRVSGNGLMTIELKFQVSHEFSLHPVTASCPRIDRE